MDSTQSVPNPYPSPSHGWCAVRCRHTLALSEGTGEGYCRPHLVHRVRRVVTSKVVLGEVEHK